MGILQLPMQVPGMVGVLPNQKFMVTTDTLATVTTAGYLNQVNLESNPVSNTDLLQVLYSYNQQTNAGTYSQFTVSITNGVITLAQVVSGGNVLLPVNNGDVAIFNGTTGQITDTGIPSANLVQTSPASHTQSISGSLFLNTAPVVVTRINTISYLSLASAGKVVVFPPDTVTARVAILDLKVFYSASGLSGGDRLLSLADGTLVFNSTGITAALLETPIFTLWGGTGNPIPSATEATISTAGAGVYLQYIGGTTDYTAGTITIAVTYAQLTT